jgi:hypothetical protein
MRYIYLIFLACVIASEARSQGRYASPQWWSAARRADSVGIARALAEGVDINAFDSRFGSALHWMAQLRLPASVRVLLAAGADPNSMPSGRLSPLHSAAAGVHWRHDRDSLVETLQALLDGGADPQLVDPNGQSALHVVARGGSLEAVRLLIARGADVNQPDDRGRTPLIAVIEWNRAPAALVGALLEAGASPLIADDEGNTPLHHLTQDRDTIAMLLMNHGADVSRENLLGEVPLCIVVGTTKLRLLSAGARECAFDRTGTNPTLHISIDRDSSSPSGIRIPCDLHDAIATLRRMLHPRFLASIALLDEEALIDHHFGLGLWLRNNWGLSAESTLSCHLVEMGFMHPDDMSGTILRILRRDLRNEDWQLAEAIQKHRVYWENMEREEKERSTK